MSKKLTSNIENYLEAVYLLQKDHGHAHVKDLARRLKIKMPSATQALGKLKRSGLVNYKKYSFVTLTRPGAELARDIYKRHKVLYNFLRKVLGVSRAVAEEDACRMEHVISSETLKKINKFIGPHKVDM